MKSFSHVLSVLERGDELEFLHFPRSVFLGEGSVVGSPMTVATFSQLEAIDPVEVALEEAKSISRNDYAIYISMRMLMIIIQ